MTVFEVCPCIKLCMTTRIRVFTTDCMFKQYTVLKEHNKVILMIARKMTVGNENFQNKGNSTNVDTIQIACTVTLNIVLAALFRTGET